MCAAALFNRNTYIYYMEKYNLKIDSLRAEIKTSHDIAFYAMQRIDLLIISVSGAGIYGCWDIIKFLNDEKLIPSANVCLLKISGFLFLLTIIVNFLGQWFSYKANIKDDYAKRTELQDIENDCVGHNKITIDTSRFFSDLYSKVVEYTNIFSLLFLISGLILLSSFICHFF